MLHFSGRGLQCALLAAALLRAAPAPAADLHIGLSTDSSAIDPHFHALAPNFAVLTHIFQPLVDFDAAQRPVPALAVAWKTIDPLTWEFELRKGVKWHDGSDFTAEDVKFSLERVPDVPNSPASFAAYTRLISGIQVLDSHTVRLSTTRPHPGMPVDLANVLIVSKKHGDGASTEDYNDGRAAIGTGPYRFVAWQRGDRLLLERNPAYWGAAPAWDNVEIRYLTNDGARVAALLAGKVQLIDAVPPADLSQLKQNKDIRLASTTSNRVIYLHMDTGREARSPFVTDHAGNTLEKNPLRDPRVRGAISRAINREAIVARVLDGQGMPAGQFLPDGSFGASRKLGPPKHDPDGARKLLADAGYPNGFGITLHAPSNRYVNGERIAEAVGEMLGRVGIQTAVETMPANLFFARGGQLEFSFMLAGWSAPTGDVSSPLRALVASFDPKKGAGIANRGRYANPALDAVLDKALETLDDGAREKLLIEASEIAMQDNAVVPILFNVNTWAMRDGLNYEPRADDRTLAMSVRPPKG